MANEPSITCPKCHRTSFHSEDITHSYCGYCHEFHSVTPMAKTTPKLESLEKIHVELTNQIDHRLRQKTVLQAEIDALMLAREMVMKEKGIIRGTPKPY